MVSTRRSRPLALSVTNSVQEPGRKEKTVAWTLHGAFDGVQGFVAPMMSDVTLPWKLAILPHEVLLAKQTGR